MEPRTPPASLSFLFSSLSLFLLLLLPLPSLSLDPTLNDDVLGLIVFKADVRDPSGALSSWNEDDESPCGWSGVKCSPRTNRVVELDLDGLGLSGRVGRGLLQLAALRRLSLANNNFTGGFSPDISRLPSLRTVDLSGNALSGSIPEGFFSQCRSLLEVSLARNAFTGQIPSTVGSCSTLAALNLSSNRLSGSLPASLWGLNGLRELDLSDNDLVGEIPVGMTKMFNLRTLILKGNQLSGQLPTDIGSCALLKSLDAADNMLTGTLPDSIRQLSMLSFLDISTNSFTGGVPDWIGELTGLETLRVSNNGFTGAVPDSISKMQSLKELDFSGNGFTGWLPESIGYCSSLTDVDFSRNVFTGSLPRWAFGLSLQRFSVAGNRLGGSIRVPTDTNLTLTAMDLSGNSFSGWIPSEIKGFHSLQQLNLSRNSLAGAIPVSIGELKELQVLDLSSNQLNSSIPRELGGAASLTEIRLNHNFLSGAIPTQIENCTSLLSLILSQNNLSGALPPNVANLTKLQTVDLSHNSFSGTLPKQLSNLAHLMVFNISHNHFSGDLPAGNFFNTIDPSSISGNPNICGAIVNVACPSVMPKPIVLNPNSSSTTTSTTSPGNPAVTPSIRQKKILLSISALIAIAAAALIALGVIAITVLNLRVRSSSASHSAAALALSEGYYSNSPGTDPGSGKLVMFSGNDPDFSAGAHAVLNKDCELGRGGFGAVYKTCLQDGRPVAIKKLTVSSLVKSQDDFEREVKTLGKLRHQNLVALEGYYWTPSLQLLIYEYVSGGSLYKHLHENTSGSVLSWQDRFDIILSMAKSLAHLHKMNIIHYNLKSSNVLIDGSSGEAKVGDYGLAKLLPMLDRYVLSSKIQSALGYMAPEFACRTVKITEKCDVYGFGVLVLETVTGKRPVEYMEDDVVVLCDTVRGALEEGRVEECVDGRIQGNFPVEEAVPVMKLGLICTSQVPSNRPDMGEVVNILELIRNPQDSQEEDLS